MQLFNELGGFYTSSQLIGLSSLTVPLTWRLSFDRSLTIVITLDVSSGGSRYAGVHTQVTLYDAQVMRYL